MDGLTIKAEFLVNVNNEKNSRHTRHLFKTYNALYYHDAAMSLSLSDFFSVASPKYSKVYLGPC